MREVDFRLETKKKDKESFLLQELYFLFEFQRRHGRRMTTDSRRQNE